MKRLILLLALFFFTNLGYSQSSDIYYKRITDSLLSYIDKYNNIYRHHNYKLGFTLSDTILNKVEEELFFNIEFPDISSNEKMCNKFYIFLDSLAQSYVYSSKLLAYKGYKELLKEFRPYPYVWQRKLGLKMVHSILDNHLRIIDLYAICYLPRELFTDELLRKISEVYTPPTLTRYEAKISAQEVGKLHNLTDTIGYTKLKKKPDDKLSLGEEHKRWNIKVDLYRAKKANTTLKVYYDSLNKVRFRKIVKARMGYPFGGGGSLEKCLARKKVYKADRMIDTLRNILYFEDWDNYNFDLDLARLRYKDYPEKMINKYANAIDTTIQYLESTNLSNEKNDRIDRKLYNYFENLLYIDTQESYYETAPLVMIQDTGLYFSNHEYIPYRIGTGYIKKLSDYIKNLPSSVMDSISGDLWYIDKKLPKGYHEKIYNWMMENKGNYELIKTYE